MNEAIDLYCEHAKEKGKLPANWRVYQWSCMPKDGSEVMYYAISGAVCEAVKKRGKHKGWPDWTKCDRSTEKTINLGVAEHANWKQEWSKRTGKCLRCTGTGRVLVSVHVTHGAKYRPCPDCNATGAARAAAESAH